MAITDAVCIPAKCGKTSRDFYMMYYKAFDGKWVLTYGKKELPRSSGGAGNAVAVKLGDLFPHLDDTKLTELLTRALFVADMWGRIDAGQD